LFNGLLTCLVRSSPIYLTAIFNRMQSFLKLKKSVNYIYVEKWTDGLVCKIVIITYLPLILACWFNRLYKEYSNNKVLCYIASISNIKKAEVRQTFNINNFK
jgi:hypothetical protein